MVIAVNTKSITKEKDIAAFNFIFETFSRISTQYQEHTFIFISDRLYDAQIIFPKNIIPVIIPLTANTPIFLKLWLNYKLHAVIKKYKVDVLVGANGLASLRTKVPQILFVNDISFLLNDSSAKKSDTNFYKKNIESFLKKASVIITQSQYAKNELMDKYKIEANKIEVIYPGVNEIFKPLLFEEQQTIKEKYAGGNEYFLFSGAIEKENNLINLLKAFSFFKKRQKSNMQLIIVAQKGIQLQEIKDSLQSYKYKNEVNFLEDITLSELAQVTASAYAMMYPTSSLNFTPQLLQSLQCHVPIITNYLNPVTEIVNDAVLLVNPANQKDIAEKIMLIFKDENLRKELIEKGKEKMQNISIQKNIEDTWQSILKTME